MAKHVDELGSFENFTAPWETATGEVEIDKSRLKRFLFGLLTDKAKAQDARDETTAQLAKVEEQLTEAKAEAAQKDPDSAGKIARLEKERDELKSTLADRDRADLAGEVAEEKGLSKAQAKYLTGSTKEELEKSADAFIKDNGIQVSRSDEDGDEDEEQPDALRRTPRRLTSPADDRKGGAGSEKEVDIPALVAQWDTVRL